MPMFDLSQFESWPGGIPFDCADHCVINLMREFEATPIRWIEDGDDRYLAQEDLVLVLQRLSHIHQQVYAHMQNPAQGAAAAAAMSFGATLISKVSDEDGTLVAPHISEGDLKVPAEWLDNAITDDKQEPEAS